MNELLNYAITHSLQLIIAGVLTFIATQCRTIIKTYKCDKQEHEQIKSTLIIILKDRLYQACKHHLKQKYCTLDDREILENMFDDYHDDYKQNGTVQKLYLKVLDLPYELDERNKENEQTY